MANITEQKVDMYITANAKCFESFQINQIRERMLNMDESKWVMIQSIQLKEPQTALLLSIFLGSYGVDRFYIGHTGMGVGKLLTCGGLGIWTIIDWFQIQSSTRAANFEKIQPYLF
jgi:TM2 domain-containing membrane protein YozV